MLIDSSPITAEALRDRWQSALSLRLAVGMASEELPLCQLQGKEHALLDRLPPVHRSQWLRGRQALRNLLSKDEGAWDTSTLSWPQTRISLTHSGSLAVAVTSLEPTQGLGIDLEWQRNIPAAAHPFFLTAKERGDLRDPWDTLRLWTIKEALFKADPRNKGSMLFEYETFDSLTENGWARSLRPSVTTTWTYDSIPLGSGFITLSVLR